MREQVERNGFPKTGDYLSAVKFVCGVPAADRERIYLAPVKGKVGLFNYALFAAPTQLTDEQIRLISTAETVAKMTEPSGVNAPVSSR